MTALLEVRAHASWARFPASWLRSRRLTEPPRPTSVLPRCQSISRGPKGWRGRSESPRLASAEAAPRRMVAAALSAAVTSTKLIGDEPHLQGAQAGRKDQLESSYSSGGSAREGLLLEKPPPSQPASASPAPHGRGGSVSRRDLSQAYRRRTALAGGASWEKRPTRIQLLFGREREGGASLREAASLATRVRRRTPAPHGRGGSVSRRDLSQAYRRRTALAGSAGWEERPTRIQLLFGRGPGGGASLREAASPGVPPRSFYWRFYEFYAFAFAYGV